jgi:glycogen operon protein
LLVFANAPVGMPPRLSPELAAGPERIPGAGSNASLGATVTAEGVNFAVYSETASALYVSIYDALDAEIGRFELDGHQDDIHCGVIANIGAGTSYGFRADGPYDPAQALHFDPNKLLTDPYARRLDRPFVRDPRLRLPREAAFDTAPLVPKSIVMGARSPAATPRRRAPQLIYELNARGYTMRHRGVESALRGTIAGLTTPQVIEHFEHLGVDTVELMPVGAFIDDAHLPALGLTNAWGYNPVTYFAPDPRLMPQGPQELRTLTELYRRHGITVILDVVYNHTGEGDANGPILSLKGLDARAYYRHEEVDGKQVLVNDTGTGNTLRCDHPATQRLVLESLRYWVEETGVSGFRFDLATVLGRHPGFDPNAEMLRLIKTDPVLSKAILIAEPWDVGPGGYQLGQFGKEFREWNDSYRDEVRSFWQGEDGRIGALAGKLSGSSEVFNFGGRKPSAGVDFLAVHDGFTLADLVSYNDKHNEANGEGNRDGNSNNHSWNDGAEGPTDNGAINAARQRDVRALLATLFTSRGTLLIQQGDEMGRTQCGNNNAYAQDNDITWLDWDHANRALVEYVAALNKLRNAHPALTADRFLTGRDKDGVRDVIWLHPDGREMTEGDWNDPHGSVLGMHLEMGGDEVLVWFNRRADMVVAQLPVRDGGWTLALVSDVAAVDVAIEAAENTLALPPRSVVLLAASPTPGLRRPLRQEVAG